jgi:RNA polymerase sigma factor (TIGR02999 family)
MGDLTAALARIEAGASEAMKALVALAYPELRKLARARLYASGPERLLDTTEVVHECYLRLERTRGLSFGDRKAFYGYAAKLMRSIIVDEVREARAAKRGGDVNFTTLTTASLGQAASVDTIEPIDEALQALEKREPDLAMVVEMRFFGGFSEPEIAEATGTSERTVRRRWERARLLLAEMLAPDDA